MLKHVDLGRRNGRYVRIEGRNYASATVAAEALGIPLPTLYARLNSPTPMWVEWRYADGQPTNYRHQIYKRRPEEWVAYRLTHKPTGKAYAGSTSNFPARKAVHRHKLNHGTHLTQALQNLFREDPNWDNWEWSGVIVSSKEEALLHEQNSINDLADASLLLNSSLTGNAPIVGLMRDEVRRAKHKLRMQQYVAENKEKVSALGKETCRKRWSDKANRRAWEGAGNPFAKKVKVDGVVYGSVKDAQRALKINEKTIRTRANSDAHPNYTFDV